MYSIFNHNDLKDELNNQVRLGVMHTYGRIAAVTNQIEMMGISYDCIRYEIV